MTDAVELKLGLDFRCSSPVPDILDHPVRRRLIVAIYSNVVPEVQRLVGSIFAIRNFEHINGVVCLDGRVDFTRVDCFDPISP